MGAGYEPHSHLPIMLPMVLCEFSPLCPPALRSARMLATSAIFWLPITRHLWCAGPLLYGPGICKDLCPVCLPLVALSQVFQTGSMSLKGHTSQ